MIFFRSKLAQEKLTLCLKKVGNLCSHAYLWQQPYSACGSKSQQIKVCVITAVGLMEPELVSRFIHCWFTSENYASSDIYLCQQHSETHLWETHRTQNTHFEYRSPDSPPSRTHSRLLHTGLQAKPPGWFCGGCIGLSMKVLICFPYSDIQIQIKQLKAIW